jgi:hypothetical protein
MVVIVLSILSSSLDIFVLLFTIKVDNNVLSGEMGEWWGLTFPFLFLQNKMDIQPLIKLM